MEFDLIDTLQESVFTFASRNGNPPKVITLSPAAFMWLTRVLEEERQVLGVTRFSAASMTLLVGNYSISIEIDELHEDFDILVA